MQFLVGFRKFTLAAVYLVVAIVLLLAGVIPAEGWLQHVTSVVVAFMGTNIGEHLIAVSKEWINTKMGNKNETEQREG